MGVLLAIVAGLVVWIVGWALGSSGLDSFLITLTLAIIAATGRIAASYLFGRRAS
jgi:hypothetical protein